MKLDTGGVWLYVGGAKLKGNPIRYQRSLIKLDVGGHKINNYIQMLDS